MHALVLVLQLHNLAGAPPRTVAAAALEVSRLYAQIGVTIAWEEQDAAIGGDVDVVRVVVLPLETGDLRRAPDTVMGAAVAAGARTRVAYVYYHRVRSEAERNGASTQQVLACAIAHELGHLLLPGEAHSATGLMRASWQRDDFGRANQGQLRFSAEQAARIRLQPSVEHEGGDRAR